MPIASSKIDSVSSAKLPRSSLRWLKAWPRYSGAMRCHPVASCYGAGLERRSSNRGFGSAGGDEPALRQQLQVVVAAPACDAAGLHAVLEVADHGHKREQELFGVPLCEQDARYGKRPVAPLLTRPENRSATSSAAP